MWSSHASMSKHMMTVYKHTVNSDVIRPIVDVKDIEIHSTKHKGSFKAVSFLLKVHYAG